jgi:hypothetical protein
MGLRISGEGMEGEPWFPVNLEGGTESNDHIR